MKTEDKFLIAWFLFVVMCLGGCAIEKHYERRTCVDMAELGYEQKVVSKVDSTRFETIWVKKENKR